ncbi:MAG: hypothetical protein KAS63_04570, partial [Candidatus Heimdallarchaeota archaeon]|nr:hypothetical protein [Candidatus Heimdallarchaeota archaeon]MCK4954609.1 hypothetical protein [Candidatus Heimdallarchaeota archaeon]
MSWEEKKQTDSEETKEIEEIIEEVKEKDILQDKEEEEHTRALIQEKEEREKEEGLYEELQMEEKEEEQQIEEEEEKKEEPTTVVPEKPPEEEEKKVEEIVYKLIDVDLWRTKMHKEEWGIRLDAQRAQKDRQWTKDMDLLGQIKIDNEPYGFLGIRERLWKSQDPLERRFVMKIFSPSGYW